MAEPVVNREEVVGLLFTVNDILWTLQEIEKRLREDDDEEEDDTG